MENVWISAIDRESGLIVMKSDRAALVADMQGNILEGVQSIPSDIQSHIAIYQAFPQLGGVVRPHARYATIFAQVGMDIPVLGTFHKDRFQVEIPCASSAMEIRDTPRTQYRPATNTCCAAGESQCLCLGSNSIGCGIQCSRIGRNGIPCLPNHAVGSRNPAASIKL